MEALTVGCHSVLIAVAKGEADIGGQRVTRVDDLEFDLTVGPIVANHSEVVDRPSESDPSGPQFG